MWIPSEKSKKYFFFVVQAKNMKYVNATLTLLDLY